MQRSALRCEDRLTDMGNFNTNAVSLYPGGHLNSNYNCCLGHRWPHHHFMIVRTSLCAAYTLTERAYAFLLSMCDYAAEICSNPSVAAAVSSSLTHCSLRLENL
jgi:hypothetical protein